MMIRVVLPTHLRALAQVGAEVSVDVGNDVSSDVGKDVGNRVDSGPVNVVSLRRVLDAIEAQYPMLRGTIRDHVTHKRRAFVRFYACERDLSHDPPDDPLPARVVAGEEPLLVVGAMAGG